ncbi:MAG TPA: hypothetical protein VF833_05000 [Gaiellaceae bacterium]
MPPLDEFARRRLGRALVSLEGAIARFEAHGTSDVEPNVNRLKRLADDIRAVLRMAHDTAPRA